MKDVKREENWDDGKPGHSDKDAVLDFAFSGTNQAEKIKNRKYANQVAKFVNWLHSKKGKKLKDATPQDANEFMNWAATNPTESKIKRKFNQANSADGSALSKFFEYIHGKFHVDGNNIAAKLSFTEAYLSRKLTVKGPSEFVDKDLKSIDK